MFENVIRLNRGVRGPVRFRFRVPGRSRLSPYAPPRVPLLVANSQSAMARRERSPECIPAAVPRPAPRRPCSASVRPDLPGAPDPHGAVSERALELAGGGGDYMTARAGSRVRLHGDPGARAHTHHTRRNSAEHLPRTRGRTHSDVS